MANILPLFTSYLPAFNDQSAQFCQQENLSHRSLIDSTQVLELINIKMSKISMTSVFARMKNDNTDHDSLIASNGLSRSLIRHDRRGFEVLASRWNMLLSFIFFLAG